MGLLTKSSAIVVASLSTTGSQVLSGNPRRVALMFSAPKTNRYTISFDSAPVSGAGIIVNPGTAPIQLLASDFGSLITKPIFVIQDTAGETIGIVETIDNEVSSLWPQP